MNKVAHVPEKNMNSVKKRKRCEETNKKKPTLHNDVLGYLFSFLSILDFLRCKVVCHAWNHVSQHSSIKKFFLFTTIKIKEFQQLSNLIREKSQGYYPNLLFTSKNVCQVLLGSSSPLHSSSLTTFYLEEKNNLFQETMKTDFASNLRLEYLNVFDGQLISCNLEEYNGSFYRFHEEKKQFEYYFSCTGAIHCVDVDNRTKQIAILFSTSPTTRRISVFKKEGVDRLSITWTYPIEDPRECTDIYFSNLEAGNDLLLVGAESSNSENYIFIRRLNYKSMSMPISSKTYLPNNVRSVVGYLPRFNCIVALQKPYLLSFFNEVNGNLVAKINLEINLAKFYRSFAKFYRSLIYESSIYFWNPDINYPISCIELL